MGSRARHGGYLFQRDGSVNWHIKYRSGGKRVEVSLGTPDLLRAKILAAPMIADHHAALLAARPRVERTWLPAYAPGLRMIDGEQAIVTDRELQFLDASGNVIRREPNGGMGELLTPAPRDGVPSFKAYDAATRPAVAVKSGDDTVLDDYLNFKNVVGYPRREAELTWQTFRALTGGKPLAKCGWDDGRALVAHYLAQGQVTATVHKRLTRLNAAVNHAIKRTGKLDRNTINPFGGVVAAKGDDSIERVALDDADMKLVTANFDKLSVHDQLLFRTCCTMGLRINEAYQIKTELQTQKGTRYCVVTSRKGGKTSTRRIPFPAHLLPHLPAVITAPLFVGKRETAGHRLNDFLRACGITAKNKVMYSLRHRAIAIIKGTNCTDGIRYALFGHIEGVKVNEVAESYGADGFIDLLKEYVDRIDGI
jgi:integrase